MIPASQWMTKTFSPTESIKINELQSKKRYQQHNRQANRKPEPDGTLLCIEKLS
jgi:hypothetical protein